MVILSSRVPGWCFRPAAIHYNIIDLWKGGKNQLGPNVGAVDIIHNQSEAGGDKSTSFNFQFSQSVREPRPQLVAGGPSLESLSLCRPTTRSDRRTRRAEPSAAVIRAAVESGNIEMSDWRSFTSNLPTTN